MEMREQHGTTAQGLPLPSQYYHLELSHQTMDLIRNPSPHMFRCVWLRRSSQMAKLVKTEIYKIGKHQLKTKDGRNTDQSMMNSSLIQLKSSFPNTFVKSFSWKKRHKDRTSWTNRSSCRFTTVAKAAATVVIGSWKEAVSLETNSRSQYLSTV